MNPRLVRGLDYYTHTAFEIISDDLGAQATVCGGGRYDGLAKELGAPDTGVCRLGNGYRKINYPAAKVAIFALAKAWIFIWYSRGEKAERKRYC